MKKDQIVTVTNVSKKFCRNLKRSMFYALLDIARDFAPYGQNINYSSQLRKKEFWALEKISFSLRKGECLGLIGHNGAGKSTLLKLLNGLIKPDKGQVRIKGRVGALIELGAGFNPILTGMENIFINGSILGLTKKEVKKKLDAIVEFSEIGDFLNTPVKNYSSGMKVRLGFAIAAQMDPDILLIDEVLAVGDAGFRIKCINRIGELLKKTAVIFVSHQISQIARICTDLMLLEKGKVIYNGQNVAKGIEHYYSQFKNSSLSIHGNGKATIHKVEMFGSNSDRKQGHNITVKYLDDINFIIHFSLTREISNAIMNISFQTRELRGVAQCYSKNCDFEIENYTNIIKISVKIPHIQFNPGLYSVSINLVDEKRRELLIRHDSVKTLQIIGSFLGDCPIQLKGMWKYI